MNKTIGSPPNKSNSATQPKLLSPFLHELAAKSPKPIVRAAEGAIQGIIELDQTLPAKYGWRLMDLESIRAQVELADSIDSVMKVYWQDIAREIEAYNIMTVWRSAELMRSALASLNAREIIAPAVLGRSLIEIASSIIWNSNDLLMGVKNAIKESQNERALVVSTELEELILRMIHGTRLGDVPKNLQQTNVLTPIQKLTKHPEAGDLLPTYEYLCELAHPNVIGNARYWASRETQDDHGRDLLRMERAAESLLTDDIRSKILWALAWSSIAICNGVEIGQYSVQLIMNRWP